MANFYPSIDTAANWAAANRVPLLDEWCLESDTRMVRIGDGVTHYNSLPVAFIAATINSTQQSGTSYTFVLADMGTVVESTGSSPATFTIPTGVFPVGALIQVHQYGSGQLTLVGAGGVPTLHYASSAATRTRYSLLTLWQRATDEWIIFGDAQ